MSSLEGSRNWRFHTWTKQPTFLFWDLCTWPWALLSLLTLNIYTLHFELRLVCTFLSLQVTQVVESVQTVSYDAQSSWISVQVRSRCVCHQHSSSTRRALSFLLLLSRFTSVFSDLGDKEPNVWTRPLCCSDFTGMSWGGEATLEYTGSLMVSAYAMWGLQFESRFLLHVTHSLCFLSSSSLVSNYQIKLPWSHNTYSDHHMCSDHAAGAQSCAVFSFWQSVTLQCWHLLQQTLYITDTIVYLRREGQGQFLGHLVSLSTIYF